MSGLLPLEMNHQAIADVHRLLANIKADVAKALYGAERYMISLVDDEVVFTPISDAEFYAEEAND